MFPKERKVVVENVMDFSSFPTTFTFHNINNNSSIHTVSTIATNLGSTLNQPYSLDVTEGSIFLCQANTYMTLGVTGVQNGTLLKLINTEIATSQSTNNCYLHKNNIVNFPNIGSLYLTISPLASVEVLFYNSQWILVVV